MTFFDPDYPYSPDPWLDPAGAGGVERDLSGVPIHVDEDSLYPPDDEQGDVYDAHEPRWWGTGYGGGRMLCRCGDDCEDGYPAHIRAMVAARREREEGT